MKYIHLSLCMFFILILCNISLVSNAQSKFSPKPTVGQEIIYDFTNVWRCISTPGGQKVTNRFAKCNPSFEEGLSVEKYYGTKQDSVHTSFAVKVVNVSPYSITFSFRLLKAYDDKKNVVKGEKEEVKDKKEKIFEDSIPALFCSHPVLVTYTPAMDRCIVSNQSELASLLNQLSQRINQDEVKPLQYPLIYAYPGELYLLNTNIDGKGSEILYILQTFCPAIELVVDAMRKSYTVGISVKGKPLDGSDRNAEYQKIVASLNNDGFSQRIEGERYVREDAFDDSDEDSDCFQYDTDNFVDEDSSAVVTEDDFEPDTASYVSVDDYVDTDSIYNNVEAPKEPEIIPVKENDRPWSTVSLLRMSPAGVIREYMVNTTVTLHDAVWVRCLRLVGRKD